MKTRALVLALAAAAFAVGAAAQDYPKLKPGLWEVSSRTSQQAKEEPPLRSSMCLDDATAKEMYNASQGMMAGMCSRFEVKREGSVYRSEATCTIGQSKMVAKSTMTLSGDASYRIEGTSTYDPPFMGMKEATTVVDAKHAGPCKPGQKPGDITTATGQTINIRNLQPPPAPPKK
jgi:hypothetical protein